ncbi:MAG: uracil-DNA glycosylase [Thermogutta sp.]|nr:uracil-DNA glycosylase [Thermogutta sp.]HOP78633.1 uracil-DNA glycosylase [Thermogutta sp.]HPU06777.1 uracil-DNA glycosylase [Thermogutta sp.]HPZ82616.1 uracil-DNA glycosylase [Thermogutta sp.]HQF13638.1 uracil-DNA glycosylase [Thermogutta sp.]
MNSPSLDPERLRRGLVQYLEDMQHAGINHLIWPSAETIDSSLLGSQQVSSDDTRLGQSEPLEAQARQGSEENRVTGQLPVVDTVAPLGEIQPLSESREDVLAELAKQVAQCTRCPELVANRTQTVFGVGNPYSELVFIGEAPGVDEDKQGEPFVGRAGQLLTAMITNGMGMRREDVYICNILRCRPPNNRTPTREEADRCRPWLDATLAVIQPKYICCLGNVAAQNLLRTDVGIGKLRGKVWEYDRAKVVCTYHPAFLLRNPAMKREAWEDLKLLLQVMGRPVPRRPS